MIPVAHIGRFAPELMGSQRNPVQCDKEIEEEQRWLWKLERETQRIAHGGCFQRFKAEAGKS
jgi:hypothetical protein